MELSSLAYFEPLYSPLWRLAPMLVPGGWLLLAMLAWLRGPTPFVWFCFLVIGSLTLAGSVSIWPFIAPLLVTPVGWSIANQTSHDVRMTRTARASQEEAEPERGGEPDNPADFDGQSQWIAVKATSTAEVANTIGLQDGKPTNWQRGLEWCQHFKPALEGEANTPCFVSPEVEGWVIVLLARPIASPREAASFLAPLSSQFGEAQYFINLPGKGGVYGWDLAKEGEVLRSLRQTERGFFFTDGEPTEVERTHLEADRVDEAESAPGADNAAAVHLFAAALHDPSEQRSEIPFAVAGAWSLDPTRWPAPQTEPEWLGLAGFVTMEVNGA